MRNTILALALLMAAQSASAGTAFFVREIQTGGMTKQCVYDYLGNTIIITVPLVSICPLSIQV
jgi:hypothetical protein